MRTPCQGSVRTPQISRGTPATPGTPARLPGGRGRGHRRQLLCPSSRGRAPGRGAPSLAGCRQPGRRRRRRRTPGPRTACGRATLPRSGRPPSRPPGGRRPARRARRPWPATPGSAAAALRSPRRRSAPAHSWWMVGSVVCRAACSQSGMARASSPIRLNAAASACGSMGRSCTWLNSSSARRPSPSFTAIHPSRWWMRERVPVTSSPSSRPEASDRARSSSPARNSVSASMSCGGVGSSGSVRHEAIRAWKFWAANRRRKTRVTGPPYPVRKRR